MRILICSATLLSAVFAAPATTGGRSLGAAIVPVGSASQHASAFDKGAQQAAATHAQGSSSYDHGTQAAKTFGNKESSGSRESFSHSADSSLNQGSGGFSNVGAFDKGSNLASSGQHLSSFGGGLGAIGSSSSVGSHQQGLHSNGHSVGQGASNFNQGHSSVKSSGSKESFHNKESFGQEGSASHAKGSGQQSHAQGAQGGHHDRGQHQYSASQGVIG
ncbi:hornerin [Galendromus occidentalis]|uniref:Hornerin n=1 Tax=Galendromus occidentalis TaxID=34638 RepID=A0AAJ6QZ00_9ACAR|nr:hornerin [Galendromus occidentalis]